MIGGILNMTSNPGDPDSVLTEKFQEPEENPALQTLVFENTKTHQKGTVESYETR